MPTEFCLITASSRRQEIRTWFAYHSHIADIARFRAGSLSCSGRWPC